MPSRPADVARDLIDGVCRLVSGETAMIGSLVALYAEPTRVVHPMSPLELPTLRTRDELRGHFEGSRERVGANRSGAGSGIAFSAVDVTVHETDDPEVVIAEFAYLVGRGGVEHRVPCVFVLRVVDGLIVESHDYADHVAMARAVGRLDELRRSLVA